MATPNKVPISLEHLKQIKGAVDNFEWTTNFPQFVELLGLKSTEDSYAIELWQRFGQLKKGLSFPFPLLLRIMEIRGHVVHQSIEERNMSRAGTYEILGTLGREELTVALNLRATALTELEEYELATRFGEIASGLGSGLDEYHIIVRPNIEEDGTEGGF